VIVTSDHGEELLEHGKVTHQQPYEEVARVPLVMRGPGIPAGARIPHWVELVDLMPTVLDAVGIAPPGHVQGESLLPLLRGGSPRSPGAFVDGIMEGLSTQASARARDIDGGPWTYLVAVGQEGEAGQRRYAAPGPGRLYRLDRDPGQQHDLRADEPRIAALLRGELLDWFARNERAGRALGAPGRDPALLSDEERERLRALGYAQ